MKVLYCNHGYGNCGDEMKFIDRKHELSVLSSLEERADFGGVMTVLMGRRRVGKTMLALHHAKGRVCLYLFVGRKEESVLCREFMQDIQALFNLPPMGDIVQFKDVFAILLDIAKRQKITLILDEFQEFFQINPSIYSDIQKMWDLNKHQVRLHAIFIGSVYSLMHKIFEDNKQPLFGRADRLIQVKPFPIHTVAEILKQAGHNEPDLLFYYYLFTGGMPKYLDAFLAEKAFTLDALIRCLITKDSLFLNEGRNVLIDEFGRDYITYFSVLELIGQGKTSRPEIESYLAKDVGGYLLRLEMDYGVVARVRPILSKVNTRNQKYRIVDNFLHFWFRFIYPHRSVIEMENFEYLRKIIKRDFTTFSGLVLERFYHQLFSETGEYNHIGSYWERNNLNEIDMVALNDLEKKIVFAEIKLKKQKINLPVLMERASLLLRDYLDYTPSFLALSVEDSQDYLPK
jgi:AAA+ ATPase superfamily predicted ATPase